VLNKIGKAYRSGELKLPEGMNEQRFRHVLIKAVSRKWNVHLSERYAHGNGVLAYLGRYLRGGPIKNSRICSYTDNEVTFVYGREKPERMSLTSSQFLNRFLQHTPVPNSVLVRSYGLYHHSKRAELDQCHSIHGSSVVTVAGFLDWQTFCNSRGDEHPELCPVCGKRLVCSRLTNSPSASAPEVFLKMPHIDPPAQAA
jgi:hypothetical protein